jgi:competence protein ComEC
MRDAGGAVVACLAVAAGVVVGGGLPPGPGGLLVVAGGVGGVGAVILRGPARGAALVLVLASAGGTSMVRARHGLERPPLEPVPAAGISAPLATPMATPLATPTAGTVVGDPDVWAFGARALVRLDGGHGQVLATAGQPAASRLGVLQAGDWVLLEGRVEPLTGRDRRYRWRHAFARLSVHDVLDAGPARSPLFALANGVRGLVLRGSSSLGGVERGLVAGFLVGDDREVPDAVAADFRASGLTHLLVVSGSNVAFVLALAGPGLRRFGMRGRLVAGVSVLLVFGAVTRWEPSVLRATAMAGVAMVAAYAGRPVPGLRILALAVSALLLADPFLIHSVGFLLSCGASAGILLWAVPLTRRLPGPAWLRESLGTTAAAQLGVAPVLLPVFGSVPLVALPANVLAAPAAAPLTVWGLASGFVGGLVSGWSPELAAILQVPTLVLVRYVALVASIMGRVPVSVDPEAAWLLVAVAAGAVGWWRWRRVGPSASPRGAKAKELGCR